MNKVHSIRQANGDYDDRSKKQGNDDNAILYKECNEGTSTISDLTDNHQSDRSTSISQRSTRSSKGLNFFQNNIVIMGRRLRSQSKSQSQSQSRSQSQSQSQSQSTSSISIDDNSPMNQKRGYRKSKSLQHIKTYDEDILCDETGSAVETADCRDDNDPFSCVSTIIMDERDDGSQFSALSSARFQTRHQSASALMDDTLSSLNISYRSQRISLDNCSRSTLGSKSPAILKKATYGRGSNDVRENTLMNTVKLKSAASFSTLEIREYPITLGDNPGGVQGPPISLDWKHDEEKTILISLDEYEAKRLPRRCEIGMYLPECLRRWKLLDKGITMKAMLKATKAAECTRRHRRNTIQSFKSQPSYISGLKDKVKMLVGS